MRGKVLARLATRITAATFIRVGFGEADAGKAGCSAYWRFEKAGC